MAAVEKCRKAHVLAVPLPAQGHVNPLMKLSSEIAKHGIKVTFVNIQSIHEKIVASAEMSGDDKAEVEAEAEDNVTLTWIPDTRTPEEQMDFFNLDTFKTSMSQSLMDLIERINSSNPDEKISCVIADFTMEWVLDVARKMGVEARLLTSPSSAATLSLLLHFRKLLEEGIIDSIGNLKKGGKVILSNDIPAWGEDELAWSFPSNRKAQEMIVEVAKRTPLEEKLKQCKWMLTNSCYEVEPAACDLCPKFLPIGTLPQTSGSKSRSNSSNFFPEDASCLNWLDNKPAGSVVYVSFGSVAIFSQQQLDELALGLELSGRAFLWVVRQDLANGSRAVLPDGFLERVSESESEIGKIVEWAPQEKVLSHPSVGCFLSHCGWNSTVEGLTKGVPFLCWPYFVDHSHNQNYICDKWETGLRITPDENGIRSRHEIKKKIDMLFSNDYFKANALRIKETCAKSANEGGSSYKNIKRLVDYIKESARHL